jgi:uncharacterized protein YjbI with pentapeptide repeats
MPLSWNELKARAFTSMRGRILQNRANFFLAAALFWFLLMCLLNSLDGKDFAWHDILVEANGMTFDLVVFGVLLSIYESISEKRSKIERLKEEIDDYRGWDEKEAMYRIVGAIKRLNRLGISKIDLCDCYLREADLIMKDLVGADLNVADLSNAKLVRANLSNADLSEANLLKADLSSANLKGANLRGANLRGANLRGANLSGADLTVSNLNGATLTIDQLYETKSLFECENLHDSLRIPLLLSHPHLFQAPNRKNK